jgi:hypothetical protein
MAQAAWARELDPDRLSFMHAVRVIKRKMPQAAAVPPERLPAWREACWPRSRGRCVSSRGRLNPRGVKRKMSNFNVRHRGAALHLRHQPVPVLRI